MFLLILYPLPEVVVTDCPDVLEAEPPLRDREEEDDEEDEEDDPLNAGFFLTTRNSERSSFISRTARDLDAFLNSALILFIAAGFLILKMIPLSVSPV